ncbi:ROK family transcriptional regulator [Paenibacillus typhae]|uniref:Sugar kinase of the NBD/HSP70 family, may contain an N-terminal HTH domain n=1 Tax=Paenibacillus typhae TaxID=1174501 RepID=A0A1G8M9S4_9BACL|nr:ROK family transcriptional regulator [Paenibacillus typhae]SDI64597.1 Sugar kinase of the NBD/HSP70 family, may contain an N-terminal HTH domain [Paenibacillus typhae]
MNMSSAGTPKAMRNMNEMLILNRIIAGGPQSRADLSRETGLSKPTISSAVTQLIGRGLVKETGRAENAQGRKATLLEFNRKCYYVIGADLGATRIRMSVADMGGEICHYKQLAMPADHLAEPEFRDFLVQGLEGLLAEAGLHWDSIQAAAFGIPGVVNPADGEVSELVLPLRGREDVLKLANLAQLLPVPVVTENDVNLAALAEYTLSGAEKSRSLLYFSIGEGTGGGLIIGGEIYRGLGGGAGELANVVLGAGRLEDILSAGGLKQLASSIAAEQQTAPATPLLAGPEGSAEQIFNEARSGNVLAESVLDAYCRLLAEALGSICAVIAPDRVVLGGGIGGNGDLLLHRLEAELAQLQRKPRLSVSGRGDKDVVLGAIQIALQAAFGRIRGQ